MAADLQRKLTEILNGMFSVGETSPGRQVYNFESSFFSFKQNIMHSFQDDNSNFQCLNQTVTQFIFSPSHGGYLS